MRILVIEDVKKLALYIKRGLEAQGFNVDCVYDGEMGEIKAFDEEYDLIILDLMLPKKDGVSICRALREENVSTPVLMLTAKRDIEDKINGLNCGADDYLTKPFDFKELLARIQALLRRPKNRLPDILKVQDIILDNNAMVVKKGTKKVELSPKEYSVLEYLMRNKNRVVKREQILDHCWDMAFDSFSNIVDVYIKKLRHKLDPDNHEQYIKTIRGVGYKIEERK